MEKSNQSHPVKTCNRFEFHRGKRRREVIGKETGGTQWKSKRKKWNWTSD